MLLNPKFLSLEEAAKKLGRSYWSVRRACLSGQLASIRFNPKGKIYVKPVDLDAYVGRCRCRAFDET
jgi:hypothetical protein